MRITAGKQPLAFQVFPNPLLSIQPQTDGSRKITIGAWDYDAESNAWEPVLSPPFPAAEIGVKLIHNDGTAESLTVPIVQEGTETEVTITATLPPTATSYTPMILLIPAFPFFGFVTEGPPPVKMSTPQTIFATIYVNEG